MFEHVGRAQLPAYFAKIHRPAQARRAAAEPRHHRRRHAQPPARRGHRRLHRALHLPRRRAAARLARCSRRPASRGLEALDVENLRPHYAKTLWAWSDAPRGAARRGAQRHRARPWCAPTGSTSPAARSASSAAGSRCTRCCAPRRDRRRRDGPMRGAQSAFPFNRGYMYPRPACERCHAMHLQFQVQGRRRRDHDGRRSATSMLRLLGREPAPKGIIEVAAHAGGDRRRSRPAVAATMRRAHAERTTRPSEDATARARSACASAPGRWSR